MASLIKVREIIHLLNSGQTVSVITRSLNTSCHSVAAVSKRMKELDLSEDKIKDLSDSVLYKLFFPDKHASMEIYESVDFSYVQKEMTRPHVTLLLLWQEYKEKCLANSKGFMSYATFTRQYSSYVNTKGFANHIYHKPGERVEVDWAGSTMYYIDGNTGKKITVYLFVGDLVCSRLAFVRPCLSMNEENWINSHIEMFKYYGGVPKTIICDNLKTGVISHPRQGEVVLTQEYESFMYHYSTAIVPAGVKKPREKNSTEGTVGNIETSIVAALRDVVFYSFDALKEAVFERLEKHNNAEFTKRSGSRWQYYIDNEKVFMKDLPPTPFQVGRWIYARCVQNNCHIAFEKNYYSVPYIYIGEKLDLKVTEFMVYIYKDGKIVKSHQRFNSSCKNGFRTDPTDMPPGSVSTTVNADTYRRWAASCGPNTSTVIERILASRQIIEQTFNSAKAVLCLTKMYKKAELESACEAALKHAYCPKYSYIKSILTAEQERNKCTRTDNVTNFGILRGEDYYKSITNKEN